MRKLAIGLALIAPLALGVAAARASAVAPVETSHAQLVQLFAEWRAFNHPTIIGGRPDYSAKAMAAKAARLPSFSRRLAAFDTRGWSASQRGDLRFVQAE